MGGKLSIVIVVAVKAKIVSVQEVPRYVKVLKVPIVILPQIHLHVSLLVMVEYHLVRSKE
jgi:hypothetical protein